MSIKYGIEEINGALICRNTALDAGAALTVRREPGGAAASQGIAVVMDAFATGAALDVTPGGSEIGLRTRGSKIDLTVLGNKKEYIFADAGHNIYFYAQDAFFWTLTSTANLVNGTTTITDGYIQAASLISTGTVTVTDSADNNSDALTIDRSPPNPRTCGGLRITGNANANGEGIYVDFPGGDCAIRVKGGMVDLSIAGDNDEAVESSSDGWASVIASGAEHLAVGAAGVFVKTGALYIQEQAAAEADYGDHVQIWVRNDNPNTLIARDDAGTDLVEIGDTIVGGLNLCTATMGGGTVTHDDYFEMEINGVTKKVMCGS